MATRCMYQFFIEGRENEVTYVYQHWDGYPSNSDGEDMKGGVLEELDEFFNYQKEKGEEYDFYNPQQIASNYVHWKRMNDESVEIANSLAPDVAYLYKIKLKYPQKNTINRESLKMPDVTFEEFNCNRFYFFEKKVHPNSFMIHFPPLVDIGYAVLLIKEGYSDYSIKFKMLAERIEWSDVVDKDNYIKETIREAKEVLNNPNSRFSPGDQRVDNAKIINLYESECGSNLIDQYFPKRTPVLSMYIIHGFDEKDLLINGEIVE